MFLIRQQKQRCKILEEELVDLVVVAMERSEEEDGNPELQVATETLWQHLSSQIIIFVLFQFASFPHMVKTLHEKVCLRTNFKCALMICSTTTDEAFVF